jgi:hypothetical protein
MLGVRKKKGKTNHFFLSKKTNSNDFTMHKTILLSLVLRSCCGFDLKKIIL